MLVGHKQQRVIERQRLKMNNVLVGRTARLKLYIETETDPPAN